MINSLPPSHSVQRSGTYSDASSVTEGLPLVTTTPDEQSQVFMVMGEDVSKSVVSEGERGRRGKEGGREGERVRGKTGRSPHMKR